MSQYRSMLVHISDSERSGKALAIATAVAAAQGASLCAVHAVEPLHLGAFLSPEAAMTSSQIKHDVERKRTAVARERVLEAARASSMEIEFQRPGGYSGYWQGIPD